MTRNPAISRRGVWRRAFNTTEVMIVVLVIAILITQAVPAYKRVTEQARLDSAAQQLMAIWSAQRVYRLEHDTYADSLTELRDLNLIDAHIADGTDGFWNYTIVSADSSSFEAQAERASGAWNGELVITQDGQVSGEMTGTGGATLEPMRF